MLSALPISAKRLRRRTVQHGRSQYRRISFFPFFDRTGTVRRVLYAAADSGEIFVIPKNEPSPRATLFKPIRFPKGASLFTPIREADLAELVKLWHYDPWWVLDEPRFQGHWVRQRLKQTNCATRTKDKLAAVYYRRDLTRLQWMARHEDGENVTVSAWSELQLPEKPPVLKRKNRKTSTVWVLDPIWERR